MRAFTHAYTRKPHTITHTHTGTVTQVWVLDLALIAVSKFISKRFLTFYNGPKCNFEILLNYKRALFYVLNY